MILHCAEAENSAGNPAATREDYFLYAVFRLRRLCVLDGEPVSAAQQAAARSRFVGRLTLEFLEERAPGTVWTSCASCSLALSPSVNVRVILFSLLACSLSSCYTNNLL